MKYNRKIIMIILLIVVALSTFVGFITKDERQVNKIMKNMTIRDKLAQMMIVSPRRFDIEGKRFNITKVDNRLNRLFENNKFGGVLLFAENFEDIRQSINFVSDIQKLNQDYEGLPLFVAVDQEGGRITRLKYGTIGLGNMALGATNDPKLVEDIAKIHAKELSLLGINLDLAPVVDINNNPNNPVIETRSFSDDKDMVAKFVSPFINGLHSENILSAVKHFPGHGDTSVDSHSGFPIIYSTYEELKNRELVPFKEAIDSGTDMIMTAHIQYPNIEKTTYISTSSNEKVYLPATLSKTILTDILRKDMGYKGLIISDALDMSSISDNFKIEDVLKLSINAGVDLLIMPVIKNEESLDYNISLLDKAVELVEDGQIDINRVNESVKRILLTKIKKGILTNNNFTLTDEMVDEALNSINSAESKKICDEAATKSITLVKNENNAFPLNVKENEEVLILFGDNSSNRIGNAEYIRQELINNNLLANGVNINILCHNGSNDEDCLKAVKNADHIVLIYRVYYAECLDPETEDGLSLNLFDEIISSAHSDNKKVVFISLQLPYDLARFNDADCLLATYGSTLLESLPDNLDELALSPNLPMCLKAVFGLCDVSGSLPVDVPIVEGKTITDKILYSRGTKAN